MTTFRLMIACILVTVTALSSPVLAAQSSARHVLDPSALASAVAERAAGGDAQRAVIQQALERPEVRGLATKAGLNLEVLTARVATLDGAELTRVAEAAQQVNQSDELVGGASTVVISTTTIIIVLLVIILIVVAVD